MTAYYGGAAAAGELDDLRDGFGRDAWAGPVMHHNEARVDIQRLQAVHHGVLTLCAACHYGEHLRDAEHTGQRLGRVDLILAHDEHDLVHIRAALKRQKAPCDDWARTKV